MMRSMWLAACLALVSSAFAPKAEAQAYRYPAGYGGWGGWGGTHTIQGDAAVGMGVYAAGAGAYNEQTAEARSINANTAMQVNEYMYQVNLQNAKTFYARQAAEQKEQSASGEIIYQRIHDNPNSHDIHSGDALNVVLDDLTNPKVYPAALQAATQTIDSDVVKGIQFRYAANMIAIGLEDLTKAGAPDILLGPAFQKDRDALKPLVQKARKEADEEGKASPETLASIRVVLKAAQDKVARTLPQGSKDRKESDNYLKALYGLTKMLKTPSVGEFLRGLDKYPSTTLKNLLDFMHSFNLRFSPAKTPIQEAQYEQLYTMLVSLRDGLKAPASNPYAAQDGKPDPRVLNQFFSGMDYGHFTPQPEPHAEPAPPTPGATR